jgi:hypothetical protein
VLFLFVFIINRFHEHDFRLDIFGDLFDLEFPEMGCFNLELPTGYGNDAVLGRLDTLADFLAFTHIDFHGLFLPANTYLWRKNPARPVMSALVYQLVYVDL